MKRRMTATVCTCIALMMVSNITVAHDGHGGQATSEDGAPFRGTVNYINADVEILHTRDHLGPEAAKAIEEDHGGSTVDRRPDHGEVYFAVHRHGLTKLSADLATVEHYPLPHEMLQTNLHNTEIFYADGKAYLAFPANGVGKVFVTDLQGKHVVTLDYPANHDFGNQEVNAYFAKLGKFAPTDVTVVDETMYITTGYSNLDYVLTAKVIPGSEGKLALQWSNLVFGGRGPNIGQFGTGHGITRLVGSNQLAVADRPRAEIDVFSRNGAYSQTLHLPEGVWPCDVDQVRCGSTPYSVVGCLHGPDRKKGSPILLYRESELIVTINPREDFNLTRFRQIHNAVLVTRPGNRKNELCIVAKTYHSGASLGDFVALKVTLKE